LVGYRLTDAGEEVFEFADGTLWLLTQGETRKTKRVRLFTEFVSLRIAAYAPLLAGLSYSRDL
jgi:hypothetical protein